MKVISQPPVRLCRRPVAQFGLIAVDEFARGAINVLQSWGVTFSTPKHAGGSMSDAPADRNLIQSLETIKRSATSALEALRESSPANDAERNLNLLKIAAETEKLEAEKNKAKHEADKIEIDASLASKQLRLSFLSTLTSQLVPLAALLTVGVTFYGAYQQNKQARIAEVAKAGLEEADRERRDWETFKGDFDRLSADDLYKRPTFIARLKAFVSSGKHASEISDISRPLLGDLTSKSAFTEVWANTYKNVNSNNFDSVIHVARAQRNKYFNIGQDCGGIPIPPNTIDVDRSWVALGPCYVGYSRDAIARAYADKPDLAKRVLEWRDQITGVNSIILFLSEQIAAYLKQASNDGPKERDMSEIILYATNLDGIDFSKTNLNQTRFYLTSLKGAVLTGQTSQMSYDFPGTSWWEVASIDQAVLHYLIMNSYPGSDAQRYSSKNSSPKEDEYRQAVRRLCMNQSAWCDKACVKFGASADPVPGSCVSN